MKTTATAATGPRQLAAVLMSFLLWPVVWPQNSQDIGVYFDMTEEQQNNTHVGNVFQAANVSTIFNQSVMATVRLQFVNSKDFWKNYFGLQESTGNLFTLQTLDRESPDIQSMAAFDANGNCTISFDLQTYPYPFLRIIRVNINLKDINDNAPIFAPNASSLTIPESAAVGSAFALLVATDADSSQFGIKNYFLLNYTDVFQMNDSTMVGRVRIPKLILRQALDRETKSSYLLTEIAVDGGPGSTQKTGSVTIDIQVGDVNDNAPIFDQNQNEASTKENAPYGTVLLTVHATDKDIGENARISYSLSDISSQYSNLFQVGPTSGQVTVVGNIDYDLGVHSYVLIVEATDHGVPPLSGSTSVVIDLQDVNDNAPTITINSNNPNNELGVAENENKGAYVGLLSTYDPDTGRGGAVQCFTDSPFFSISPAGSSQFKILTTVTFDREVRDSYLITITCRDEGDVPLSSSTTVVIRILDVNDNAPYFDQTNYPVYLDENNAFGLKITQVQAYDMDIGVNAQMTYRVDPLYQNLLSIDSDGSVRTKYSFDYERQTTYSIPIYAVDGGTPPLTGTATIALYIRDLNDNNPIFNESSYAFAVNENEPIGTLVGSVHATDLDSPPFNIIDYSLDQSSPDASSFAISQSTGQITTMRMLDREQKDTYHFVARANNPQTTTYTLVNVTVAVLDENDNAPIVLFPTGGNDTVTVPSNAKIGSLVTRVLTYDADIGLNGQLNFTIIAGNRDQCFYISPKTGEILVNRSLSNLGGVQLHLSMSVQDMGVPPYKVFCDLKVNVAMAANISEHSSGINVEVVIIASLLSLVFVLLVAVIAVCLHLRHRKRAHRNEAKLPYHPNHQMVFERMPSQGSQDNMLDSPKTEKIQMNYLSFDGKENTGYHVHNSPFKPLPSSASSPCDTLERHPHAKQVRFESSSTNDASFYGADDIQEGPPVPPRSSKSGSISYSEPKRMRLLYNNSTSDPRVNRAGHELGHIQALDSPTYHSNTDQESDQCSSVDSGRGPSEDEHGRLQLPTSQHNPPTPPPPCNPRDNTRHHSPCTTSPSNFGGPPTNCLPPVTNPPPYHTAIKSKGLKLVHAKTGNTPSDLQVMNQRCYDEIAQKKERRQGFNKETNVDSDIESEGGSSSTSGSFTVENSVVVNLQPLSQASVSNQVYV